MSSCWRFAPGLPLWPYPGLASPSGTAISVTEMRRWSGGVLPASIHRPSGGTAIRFAGSPWAADPSDEPEPGAAKESCATRDPGGAASMATTPGEREPASREKIRPELPPEAV